MANRHSPAARKATTGRRAMGHRHGLARPEEAAKEAARVVVGAAVRHSFGSATREPLAGRFCAPSFAPARPADQRGLGCV